MRALWLVALLALAAQAAEKTVQRDDGKQAGKMSRAGSGHVIALRAPKGRWWVKSVSIHGQRYGGGYDPAETELAVTICDESLKVLGGTTAPYERFGGRFEWVEIPLDEAVAVPREFKVVVEFHPTATKGVYVAYCETKESHSGYGVPAGREQPVDFEWMIRARVTNRKPKAKKSSRSKTTKRKPSAAVYRKDFEFLRRTVRDRFPALEKKGVDWAAVCEEWRPRFEQCPDDATHLRNAYQLLAVLNDMHTGIFDAKEDVAPPAFAGLFGGGIWVATEKDALVVRALMDKHPLARGMPRGSVIETIDGRPADEVHREVRARVRRWYGMSSAHFLDARLSFQFFPFDDRRTVRLGIRTPEGERREVDLPRWGPGGRGLSRVQETMPAGVAASGLAVSAMLDDDKRIGYVRILGGMNDKTQAAFDAAFDRLRDAKGILLDCRGMGGGGDGPAWAMAGRFFKKRVARPAVKPTGRWQFRGPVVMLQDERMVSSAETFTWAMTETGRALSVGRPTGGATIIPKPFEVPSHLFRFRLGVHDRRTPVKGIQPEGVGTPPDVYVAYDPQVLAKERDPVLATGRKALAMLLEGKPRDEVVAALRTRPPG